MMRWLFSLGCLLCCLPYAVAAAEPTSAPAALRQIVTLDFDNLTLAECAERLRTLTGANVIVHESLKPLLVMRENKLKADKQADEQAADPSAPAGPETVRNVEQAPGFSCKLRGLPLSTALRILLDHYGLGYTVVGDSIVIAAADKARQLELEQIISVKLDGVTLAKAIEDLRAQYALSVIVDAQAAKDAKITLDAQDVSLEEAVRLLADQATLKLAPLEKGWLLTSADKAKEWQNRAAQRRAETKAHAVTLGQEALGGGFGIGGGGIMGGGIGGGIGGGGFTGGFPGGASGGLGGAGFIALAQGQTVEIPRALLQLAGPAPRGVQPLGKIERVSPPPMAPPAKKSAAADTLKKMQEPFDFPAQPQMTFKDAIAILQDGGCPPIVVHTQAFKDESPDAPDLYEAAVRPLLVKGLTRGKVLRFLLEQVSPSATYLVRPGHILVTTNDASRPNGQFIEGASFVERPLDEALQELSELSGISIVLDPRVGAKGKTPITARFPSQTNVAQATRVLADMADLKAVMVDTTMYVTSRSNATVFPEEAPGPGKSTRRDAGA